MWGFDKVDFPSMALHQLVSLGAGATPSAWTSCSSPQEALSNSFLQHLPVQTTELQCDCKLLLSLPCSCTVLQIHHQFRNKTWQILGEVGRWTKSDGRNPSRWWRWCQDADTAIIFYKPVSEKSVSFQRLERAHRGVIESFVFTFDKIHKHIL